VIVLDTTILAYAVGEAHQLREPCRRVLTAHAEGVIQATTTIEVIQEFAHVRSQRRSRADAARIAIGYTRAFDLLVTGPEDLERGLDLFQHHPRVGSFDAVLAAVALNRGATALISADRSFGSIPGLKWIDPSSSALRHVLAEGTPRVFRNEPAKSGPGP
jgi:predicted nucleic acid-binding protein